MAPTSYDQKLRNWSTSSIRIPRALDCIFSTTVTEALVTDAAGGRVATGPEAQTSALLVAANSISGLWSRRTRRLCKFWPRVTAHMYATAAEQQGPR